MKYLKIQGMKFVFVLFLFFSTVLRAQSEPIKSPGEIQEEIDQAQRDFEIAQKMFIPWYTGPLITGSASNVPVGKYVLQPYVFFNWQFAEYNAERESVSIPDLYTLEPFIIAQRGLLDWLDISVTAEGFFRWQDGNHASGYGDMSVILGFQLLKEKPYVPNVRLFVGESFPTGRYQRLSRRKGGIDATGSGAYETSIGLNISKIFWQIKLHPIRVRFSSQYAIPNHRVNVHQFNAYGGGFGTAGKVRLGHALSLDLGIEVSLTQKWVFANDFVYAYGWPTTFSGNPGTTALGTAAGVGGPSFDQFSLAPAIEYNRSSSDGFIGGVWFSATGRNSPRFAALVLSYYVLF